MLGSNHHRRGGFEEAAKKFGKENIRFDKVPQKGGAPDFPVLTKDSRVVSSLSLSHTLNHLPPLSVEYVFINPDLRNEAQSWLEQNRDEIIKPETEVEEK